MTYVKYVNDCLPLTTCKVSHGHGKSVSVMSVALLIFSSIALILEVIAQVVLCHSGKRRFGSLRKSLITLTSIEMWLNSSIFIHKAWEEFGMEENETLPSFICSFVFFSLLNNAICSRNWAVTLIALARCEVITRPVAHRVSTHIFSPSRQAVCISILVCLGMVISVFRLLFRSINVCTNLGGVIRYPPHHTTNIQIISEKIFFAYQSAIPISIVSLATLFMTITLLRSSSLTRRSSSCEAKMADGRIIPRVHQRKKSKNKHQTPKQVRATRAILLITGVFVVCEAPIFFAVVLAKYTPDEVTTTIYKSLRFLIATDTYANFMIYLLTSRQFRISLQHIFTCGRGSFLRRKATSRSVTHQMQLSINGGSMLNVSSSGEQGSVV